MRLGWVLLCVRSMQPQCPPERRGISPQLGAVALIAAISLALRWWRQDLMSFRFDSAEAMFRARDTFSFHFPPLTGIENSIGFRNPAGFIWLILPTTLANPDPRLTAAWIGLISLSGLWPIYKISRHWLPGWSFLIPCAAFALMPSQVFAGRAIWAQNLMPAMAAWSLWGLVVWSDEEAGVRKQSLAASGALAMMLFATTVHLSGAAYVAVIGGILFFGMKWKGFPSPRLWATLLSIILFVLAVSPSLADWRDSRIHPRPKADHIVQFESRMPPPKNIFGRLHDSLAGLFDPFSSLGATSGIDNQLTTPPVVGALTADILLILLSLGGLAAAMLLLRKLKGSEESVALPDSNKTFVAILLAWLFGPILLGAVAIPRVNGSYFAPALPAMLLLCGFAISKIFQRFARWVAPAIFSVIVIMYCWFFVACIFTLDNSRYVAGIYYIPLREQIGLVDKLYDHYVPSGKYVHLSGNWFQRSYDYIYKTMKSEAVDHFSIGRINYGVIEDLPLRQHQAARAGFFKKNINFSQGNVGVVLFDSPNKTNEFVQQFWNVPIESMREAAPK